MAYRVLKVDPRSIRKVQRQFNRLVDQEIREAMVRLAQFGRAQVVKHTARARPRPYATGAFAQGWTWARTADGAVLWNSAKHGVFVELGRRPGRPPPLQAILDWLEAKGLAKRASRVKCKKTPRPRPPKKPGGRSPRARGPRASPAARPTAKAQSAKKALEATAWAIAHKIARDGIKARPVLGNAWPSIVKRAPKEFKVALASAVRKVKPV